MQLPERIHFFSYATGVSLELPLGFTAGGEQPDGAVYVRYDDDDEVAAVVLVTVVAAGPLGAQDAAAAALVDGMSSVADEVLEHSQRQIDDEQVASAVLHFPRGLPAGGVAAAEPEAADLLASDLLVLFAATGFGGRVVTLTAAAPFAQARQFRPVFAQALASCRFVAGVTA